MNSKPVPIDRYSGTIGLYHGPLYLGPNGFETYRPYASYIREFARHFEKVLVFAPVTREETVYRGCKVDFPNVRIVPLPHFNTHLQALRHVFAIRRMFRAEIANLDVINCRNTAPFGSMLYLMTRKKGVAFFYHFTSDPWAVLTAGTRYTGIKGLLSRTAYRIAFSVQTMVMRRTYSFVNGKKNQALLSRHAATTEAIISSTLTNEDFKKRDQQTLHTPARLLYVGYLKHMKGLEYLIGALELLKDRGLRLELNLVGDGPMSAPLRSLVNERQLSDQVHFSGYVADPGELYRHYDDADIFVFPSLSEGSPRVILEALARNLPVISTPVGSVPDMLVDGESAILVQFRDELAIEAAINRLVLDNDLRAKIARNGYEIARQYTVETFVGRMAEKAKELARKRTTT